VCIHTHRRFLLLRGEDDVVIKINAEKKQIKKIRIYTADFFSSVVKKMV